ncbi:hypothetical protein ASG99_27715 [Bacillus sp. Soil768D1]|nr:hypothetical protein ASG99_27715 [Bacillus sp. Soil768D1]
MEPSGQVSSRSVVLKNCAVKKYGKLTPILVKVGVNMNIGDMIFQLVSLIFIFGIFSGVFFLVRSLVTKQPSKSASIEQKLDRIIELLEKDKKK